MFSFPKLLQLLQLMLAIFSLLEQLRSFKGPLILPPYLHHLNLEVKVLKVKLQDL